MKPKLFLKVVWGFISLLLIRDLFGCTTADSTNQPFLTNTASKKATSTSSRAPTNTPTHTFTTTNIPTKTPVPTATRTPTPEPTTKPTLEPIPTFTFTDPSAIVLNEQCRSVMDGMNNLKKDLGIPEHLNSGEPFRQPTDFDLQQYLKVLNHLKIDSGYKLDYVYLADDLGGKPLLYVRKSNSKPFQSYEEFLGSYGEEMTDERSYGQLSHAYDYLQNIHTDGSPESFLQFVILALLGDQFYLFWHGLYNDTVVLYDIEDLRYVEDSLLGFDLTFPEEIIEKIKEINFTSVIMVGDETVTVRFVTFTKWGGFFEVVFVIDKENPEQLLDVQWNPLIKYDCGINF
jgi:hypothetical protein